MKLPAQTFDIQAKGNDTPFNIALCGLDMDIPATPEGGDTELKYRITRPDFERIAPTLLNKPLKMALPADSHENADGTPATPIGVITGWSVAENPEGLPEGTYAVITGQAWEKDHPLEVSILVENKDDWGSSWELSGGDSVTPDEEGRVHLCSGENPTTFDGAVALPRDAAAYQQYTKIMAAAGRLQAVYSGPGDDSLPENVKKMPDEKRKVFVGAFNGAFTSWSKEKDKEYDDSKTAMQNRESYAYRVAYAQVNKMDAATDEDKAAQEERSKKYGIATPGDEYFPQLEEDKKAGLTEEDYADPTSWSYPVWLTKSKEDLSPEQLAQVRNAPARFAQFGGRYDPKSRRVVYNRIVEALKKFGIGAFREVAASALLEELACEEGTPGGGGETKVTEEDLQMKVTTLQQEVEALKAQQSKYATSLAEVLRIQATAGVDDDPTPEEMLTLVQETRELLCSILPEDKHAQPLKQLAATVVESLKAEQAAKVEAQQETEAVEQFEEIKERYPEEAHEEVKSCCLNLAKGVDMRASAKRLVDLLPKEAPPAKTEDPPDLSAGRSKDAEEKYTTDDGDELTVVELMLKAASAAQPR